MHKDIEVLSICNALVDLLIEIDYTEFAKLNLKKGIMHLVDSTQQEQLLSRFKDHALNFELGGSAMNATRALAALGSKAMFFGMVGNDYYGEKIATRMRELDILSRIAVADEPTGVCAILITPDGERTMNTCLGASSHYHEGVIPHDDIARSKILFFTGYQWSTPHQKKAVKRAIKTAKESKTLVAFDIADPFMVAQCKDEFKEIIRDDADIVFANAEEARSLYDCSETDAAVEIAKNNALAVVKRGSHGALIVTPQNEHIPVGVVPTNVIDTTAAGDMFAGGFLYGYVRNKPLKDCGQIASILASDVISRIGAKLSDEAVARAREV